jgi:Polysaccharide pyruvyl transferase
MKVALIAPQRRVEDSYRHSSEHLFRKAGANIGNFAFVQALWAHLEPHVEIFPWEASPDAIRERSDVIVMACANQLGPHSNLERLAILFERARLPILAIGLGAQANEVGATIELTSGTRRWLDVVAAHSPSKAPNIGVRGEYSREQVERNGMRDRAVVTGCPSNFINPDPSLAATLEKRYRRKRIEHVAVPAGLHHWAKLGPIERALADIVESTSGSYIAQSEIDMIRMARGEWDTMASTIFRNIRDYIRPGLSDDAFRLWCKRYATCFADATSWMESMRSFDFVVGPRFHGVMLAMQANTPGGVIAHDSRTFEMCDTMKIPVRMDHDMPAGFQPSDLPALFEFEAEAYSRRRLELAEQYLAILTGAGIKPSQGLLGLGSVASDTRDRVTELAPTP